MREFEWFIARPRDSSLNCNSTRNTLKTYFYSNEKALKVLKREYEATSR